MSWVSQALDHMGPIGKLLNRTAKDLTPIVKSEAETAVNAAIDKGFANATTLTKDEIKAFVDKEIESL